MPILPNARHEAFAQARAQQKTVDDAYVAAGFAKNRGNASRLNANEGVQKRIAELQQKGVERTLVTVESITAELEQARALAMSADSFNPSAAVAASMGKAKLHGLLVERSENLNTNYNISDEPPTDAEWEAEHTKH